MMRTLTNNLHIRLNSILKPRSLIRILENTKLPVLVGGVCFLSLGFFLAYFLESDYEQGQIFKLLYLHVPASWWALGIYSIMAMCAALGFIMRVPQFHLMAKSWAIPGLIFTLISLGSGMIWGKLTWGTYWVWDARLTTMFIQLLIYLGYICLTHSGYDMRQFLIGSVLLIVGMVNLPLIKYSVEWWLTLHQGASLKIFSKNAIHQTYMPPLILNSLGFFMVAVALFCKNMKNNLSKLSL